MKSNNKTATCADKYKQNSSAYNIEVKEKTSGGSEKKENAWDVYVGIYKLGKQLFNSTFENVCAA